MSSDELMKLVEWHSISERAREWRKSISTKSIFNSKR